MIVSALRRCRPVIVHTSRPATDKPLEFWYTRFCSPEKGTLGPLPGFEDEGAGEEAEEAEGTEPAAAETADDAPAAAAPTEPKKRRTLAAVESHFEGLIAKMQTQIVALELRCKGLEQRCKCC